MHTTHLTRKRVNVTHLCTGGRRIVSSHSRLVINILKLHHTSSTILLTNGLVSGTGTRTRTRIGIGTTRTRTSFHEIGKLNTGSHVPPGLHDTCGTVTGGSRLGQRAAHLAHSILSHTLGSVTDMCHSITILRGGTRSSINLVGLRGHSSVARLSIQLAHKKTIQQLRSVTITHHHLTNGNGPMLIFRTLFYSLVTDWNWQH